jgi:C_GCAxxG_C_C family probable redox protein
MEIKTQEHVDKAVSLFKSGYNCSQAVFMAYSELYGIDIQTAAKIATSFGGGMGRLREVCGAVSGMFIILGLQYPYTNPQDKSSKNANYKAVQEVAQQFKNEMGSYICADLLKIKHVPQNPVSETRSEAYYKSRPCTRCVAVAAEIVGNKILNE